MPGGGKYDMTGFSRLAFSIFFWREDCKVGFRCLSFCFVFGVMYDAEIVFFFYITVACFGQQLRVREQI